MRRLGGAFIVAALWASALTLSPTQHDFGRWAVGAQSPLVQFRVTLPPGATATDSIDVAIVGADVNDFDLSRSFNRYVSVRRACLLGTFSPAPGTCDVDVSFRPRSIGPKTARLQVVDRAGTMVTASLRGLAVAPVCEMKVVSCNYAHLYSGSFSWQSDLSAPYGQNRKSVNVNVVNGHATCDGSETDVSIDNQGRRNTQVGTILGDGLIAIEFEKDSTGRDVYRITAACPSPAWPATPDQGARAPQPAELGSSYFEESYQQPMAQTMPLTPAALRGGRRGAHPDVDAANAVIGTMSVSWSFTRSQVP